MDDRSGAVDRTDGQSNHAVRARKGGRHTDTHASDKSARTAPAGRVDSKSVSEHPGRSEDGTAGFPGSDGSGPVTVEAIESQSGSVVHITYSDVKAVGTGSFGTVFCATLDDGRGVAIKRVLQDERYKNRELQILKDMHHVNVVVLYYYFFALSGGDNYLNLIQEFVPQTLSRLIKHHWRIRQAIPLASVKLYSFQLLRGLAYIHHRAVCHRDIKPQNLLINPEQGTLKICDFGSAKILNPEEPNVSYICSRYYRAPELIFGATHYTVSIDMWSAGCVIGELLLGRPVFPGSSGVDQLVEIIKILGTPTPEQVREMNPDYSEFKFPNINGCSWEKLIRNRSSESAFPVLRRLLIYSPRIRATASNILADPFFADLIFPPPGHPPNATGHLPNGKPAPQFPSEFTESEMEYLPESLVSRIRHFQNAAAEVSRKSNEARERSSSSQSSPEAINRMQGKNPRESHSDTLRPLQLTTGKHCSACLRTSGSVISRSQTRSMAMSAVDVRAKPVVLRYNQRSARRADNRLSESVDFEATTRTAVARRVETSLSTRPHRSVSYLSQSFHPGALSENAFQSPQRPKSRNAQSNRVSVFGSSFSHKNEIG